MKAIRTPEERFEKLAQFDFRPHYQEIDGMRLHYLDEGAPEGEVALLLHGEPSWCYLYRKMIPPLAQSGLRVIAPDLFGFGRSDKPVNREDYSYQRHIDWMKAFIHQLDLREITLFGQDWGGLIGLRIAAEEEEERFKRIVAANTFLPTGDIKPSRAFLAWRTASQRMKDMKIGSIVNGGTVSELSADTIAAYDAPFPDESYKAGARAFPLLVPIDPNDPASEPNREAWKRLRRWKKPFLTTFSDSDPIMSGVEIYFQRMIPGAKGQPHVTIEKAGHFLQEDQGPRLAEVMIDFISKSG